MLGVMEARGRTFQNLYVLGMNRGVFPRSIVEDPLFSDSLRARLRACKQDGCRYHYANPIAHWTVPWFLLLSASVVYRRRRIRSIDQVGVGRQYSSDWPGEWGWGR